MAMRGNVVFGTFIYSHYSSVVFVEKEPKKTPESISEN